MITEEMHVVTCFMEHGEKISLLKRSERVDSYRGSWAGISGYLEEGNTPYQQALEEIIEETGLKLGCIELVKESKPLEVVDDKNEQEVGCSPLSFKSCEAGED